MKQITLFKLVERWMAAKQSYVDTRDETDLWRVAEIEKAIENLVKQINRERWARHHATNPAELINNLSTI